jgi:hypothetical protein
VLASEADLGEIAGLRDDLRGQVERLPVGP